VDDSRAKLPRVTKKVWSPALLHELITRMLLMSNYIHF